MKNSSSAKSRRLRKVDRLLRRRWQQVIARRRKHQRHSRIPGQRVEDNAFHLDARRGIDFRRPSSKCFRHRPREKVGAIDSIASGRVDRAHFLCAGAEWGSTAKVLYASSKTLLTPSGEGQQDLAAPSCLGVSPHEIHLTLFPQGLTASERLVRTTKRATLNQRLSPAAAGFLYVDQNFSALRSRNFREEYPP